MDGSPGSRNRARASLGDAPVCVEIHASDETVAIFVEADFETHAEERRRQNTWVSGDRGMPRSIALPALGLRRVGFPGGVLDRPAGARIPSI